LQPLSSRRSRVDVAAVEEVGYQALVCRRYLVRIEKPFLASQILSVVMDVDFSKKVWDPPIGVQPQRKANGSFDLAGVMVGDQEGDRFGLGELDPQYSSVRADGRNARDSDAIDGPYTRDRQRAPTPYYQTPFESLLASQVRNQFTDEHCDTGSGRDSPKGTIDMRREAAVGLDQHHVNVKRLFAAVQQRYRCIEARFPIQSDRDCLM